MQKVYTKKYSQAPFKYCLIAQNSHCMHILKKNDQKTLNKLTRFFLLYPVPLYGHDYEKQKGPGTSYQSLCGLQKMFRKIPFLAIYHLGNFDDLIQSGFLVIPKISFANLCNPALNIIIPVSSDHLNLENLQRKGKKITKI